MARGIGAIAVFGLFIFGVVVFGGCLLNRRWDRRNFYE